MGAYLHFEILSSVHPWAYLFHSYETAHKPTNELGVVKTKKYDSFSARGVSGTSIH